MIALILDAFFAFTSLMSEFRDHFIRSLDNVQQTMSPDKPTLTDLSNLNHERLRKDIASTITTADSSENVSKGGNGIGNSMNRLMRRLKREDVELYQDLVRKWRRDVWWGWAGWRFFVYIHISLSAEGQEYSRCILCVPMAYCDTNARICVARCYTAVGLCLGRFGPRYIRKSRVCEKGEEAIVALVFVFSNKNQY